MNRFTELLASLPEGPAREALKNVGDQHPEVSTLLSEGFLRQDEFSRRMDEVRDKVKFADDMTSWWKDQWVPDAYGQGKGATKAELEKDRQIEQLRVQAASGGEMNFDDLNKYLDEQISSRGIVTRKDLDTFTAEKGKEVNELVDAKMNANISAYAYAATALPKLMLMHDKEFGEILDPNAFLKAAGEAGATDLEKFHGEFVRARREEKQQKEIDAKIAAAKEEGLQQGRLERSSQPTEGATPMDLDGPSLGHMQVTLTSRGKENAQGFKTSPAAELGSGQVAREAAIAGDRAQITANAG